MKTRTITLKKKDLLYEIDVATYSLADTMSDDAFKTADATRSNTDEALDKRTITRMIDTRVSLMKNRLSKFLVNEDVSSSDNTITDGDYVFSFYLEGRFRDELMKSVAELCHKYVIDSVLADWYNSVGNEIFSVYSQKADLDLVEIEKILRKKNMPKYED